MVLYCLVLTYLIDIVVKMLKVGLYIYMQSSAAVLKIIETASVV